ncbi:hypothetical protein [Saccharopolyspora gregorii]|uniref:Uncharacterized protein n=1 Tax=Saccharopolyspora gregorii TaxID=33914 RepID=A0ABP6RJS4_9PSEU
MDDDVAPAVPGGAGEQPVGEAPAAQVVDDAVFDEPGARRVLDVLPAGVLLEHLRVDPGP